MPLFKVTLEGAPEFLQLLDELGSGDNGAIDGLLAVAEQFVSDAQSDCPVDTGLLQSEIGITDQTQDSVTVESPTPYAGFVDGGTIYQSPQPYFTGNVERLASAGGMVEATDAVMQYWQDLCDRLSR